jgi:6-phosphogluconolactonase
VISIERVIALAGILLWFCPALAAEEQRRPNEVRVYIGTYTGEKSQGIYTSVLKLDTGTLTEPELAAETVNPSFLAIHPKERLLYAVNEVGNFKGNPGGGVSAFKIDESTGKLELINEESSVGAGPCHLVVDAAGQHVLVANYGGGSVAVLPILEGGALGKASGFVQHEGSSVHQRQGRPHAHSINLDARNRFAVCADLGLDQLLVYKFDPKEGSLTPNDPPMAALPPGSGPRHFSFHPNGRNAYVINELNCTATAFRYDPLRGQLTILETVSTLPPGESVEKGYSTAEILAHPSGKFVYGSNRGHDTIVVYAVDSRNGTLSWVENQPVKGRTPRNFGIEPTGRFLLAANQNSDAVVVFAIDQESGKLSATGGEIRVGTPVCVRFLSPR